MRIAICDDERQEREAVAAALTAAAGELSLPLRADAYSSGEALIRAVEEGEQPDLAILDVYMEGMSGLDTARRLRELLPGVPLAFLTVSRDFAVDAFAMEALHYMIKPVTDEAAAEQLEGEPDFLRVSRGCIVNLNDVLYLGRSGFHLKGGETLAVSRRERPAVQERYNDYLFRKLDQAGEAGL